MEWKADDIQVWEFPRFEIPANIRKHHPDPTTWGKPLAKFRGTCDFGGSFSGKKVSVRDVSLPEDLLILHLGEFGRKYTRWKTCKKLAARSCSYIIKKCLHVL
jgi:hypothetical protein